MFFYLCLCGLSLSTVVSSPSLKNRLFNSKLPLDLSVTVNGVCHDMAICPGCMEVKYKACKIMGKYVNYSTPQLLGQLPLFYSLLVILLCIL